jgi:hypothetical protein
MIQNSFNAMAGNVHKSLDNLKAALLKSDAESVVLLSEKIDHAQTWIHEISRDTSSTRKELELLSNLTGARLKQVHDDICAHVAVKSNELSEKIGVAHVWLRSTSENLHDARADALQIKDILSLQLKKGIKIIVGLLILQIAILVYSLISG